METIIEKESDLNSFEVSSSIIRMPAIGESAALKPVTDTESHSLRQELEDQRALVQRQKEVIDVLNSLLSTANESLLLSHNVVSPMSNTLDEKSSMIISANNSTGDSIIRLTESLENYAEQYQLRLIEVHGKLA